MSFIDYNSRRVSSYRPKQDMGLVSDPFRLHDSSLQHHSLGGYADLENYPVRNSRTFHVNELIGKTE